MGYSTTTYTKNKIARKNSISQYISVIDEYSDSVIDNVIVFLLHERHEMTNFEL